MVTTVPDDEWLTIGEACKLLNVSVWTLRRWENSGYVESARTPTNQRRYRRSDVEALLDSGKGSRGLNSHRP